MSRKNIVLLTSLIAVLLLSGCDNLLGPDEEDPAYDPDFGEEFAALQGEWLSEVFVIEGDGASDLSQRRRLEFEGPEVTITIFAEEDEQFDDGDVLYRTRFGYEVGAEIEPDLDGGEVDGHEIDLEVREVLEGEETTDHSPGDRMYDIFAITEENDEDVLHLGSEEAAGTSPEQRPSELEDVEHTRE